MRNEQKTNQDLMFGFNLFFNSAFSKFSLVKNKNFNKRITTQNLGILTCY